jgi:hypothetical protein
MNRPQRGIATMWTILSPGEYDHCRWRILVRRVMCSGVGSVSVVAGCVSGDIATVDVAGLLNKAVASTRDCLGDVVAHWKDGMLPS